MKQQEENEDSPQNSRLALGMSLGMSFGASIGTIIGIFTSNIGFWITLGAGFGMSMGIALAASWNNTQSKKK